MDAAVRQAVADAIGRGEKVLLQVMDASKLGWRAPSLAWVDGIMAAWPGDVCVVADACQMRLGRGRLGDYLDRNFLVLIDGIEIFHRARFQRRIAGSAGAGETLDACAILPKVLPLTPRALIGRGTGRSARGAYGGSKFWAMAALGSERLTK